MTAVVFELILCALAAAVADGGTARQLVLHAELPLRAQVGVELDVELRRAILVRPAVAVNEGLLPAWLETTHVPLAVVFLVAVDNGHRGFVLYAHHAEPVGGG